MKLDYKPKTTKTGLLSPRTMSRGAIHSFLIVASCFCFILAATLGKTPNTNSVEETALKLETPSNNKELIIEPEKNTLSVAANTEKPPIVDEPKETPQEVWHDVKIQRGDTLGKIFKRLELPTKDLKVLLSTKGSSSSLTSLKPGQTLKLCVNQDQEVNKLTLDVARGNTLELHRKGDKFKLQHKVLPLEKQLAFGKGEIKSSLFSSAKKAGLDNKIVSQMVEIFSWNIDFSLDLQPKDTFKVLYEEKRIDGEKIGTGHILAAEIINDGKKHLAIRYTDKSGHTGYFSPDGYGMHQAFLRNPVNFTRISSHFGPRSHPILHKMRAHNGVDYSAPIGTPVQTTGDGKIVYMGTRGGYGKVIEIQHGSRYSTLYAHLSKFAPKLRVNQEIKQGTIIGYVGASGLATGPHLHYEFRIDGIHRNPLTVALPRQKLIPDANKNHFLAHAKEVMKLMQLHENKVDIAWNQFSLNE